MKLKAADRLTLRGLAGFLKNEEIQIGLGKTVTVGRSRYCDLSTRRSKTFLKVPPDEQRQILYESAFNKVSRRHVRISFSGPNRVEIEDLSKNGTFVNGDRVRRLLLTHLEDEGVEIRLSDAECLQLSLE
jgi:pSer/pThr/pTyr-binding forkhead associated (FHA) protein